MTKAELIQALEPYSDETEIIIKVNKENGIYYYVGLDEYEKPETFSWDQRGDTESVYFTTEEHKA